MTTNAVDVSQWQGKIDWAKVKAAGYTATAIKLTDGLTWNDPDAVENVQGAKAVGLHLVYYHYGHPKNDPILEAEHFIEVIKRVGLPDGNLVLDIEENDGLQDVSIWAVKFLDHVHSILNHQVAWYTYDSFVNEYMKAVHVAYPSWVASYGSKPTHKWFAWQMSDKGQVPGINGYVDIDQFNPEFLKGDGLTVLQFNDSGDPVKVLQEDLNKIGFHLTVDGVYGANTEEAVKKFQQLHGLSVDGVYGPLTEQALMDVFKVHPTPAPAPVVVPQPVLVSVPTPSPVITKFIHDKGNVITLVIAVIGAVKLIAQAFGVDLGINGVAENEIANAVAGAVSTLGIFMTHNGTKTPSA